VVRRIGRWTASRYAAVAVAGLTGVLVLSGCGQTRLGAAALYGSQRVSSSKLTAEVANLNAGYSKYRGKVQIAYTQAEMPQQVLTWLMRFAAFNQIAASHHITVTPANVQSQLQSLTSEVGQNGNTLPEAAVAAGLPPDLINQLGVWFAIETKLRTQLDNGVAPKSTSASNALDARVTHLQCLAAKNLNIKVNPQYGVYDYGQLVVVAAPVQLSATSPAANPSASPSASPKIQTTPKC
jgi:hypothetical protein